MRAFVFKLVTATLEQLVQEGTLPDEVLPLLLRGGLDFKVERPREKSHGDFSTNAALVLARMARMKPRDLAQKILDALPLEQDGETRCEIAGPGFINFYLSPARLRQLIPEILSQRDTYGHSRLGEGKRVLVEFVSANPTGPMHVGHGRGAVTGDAIARLLSAVGFHVEREYYINDAGNQVDVLGRSVLYRYREIRGLPAVKPPSYYPGEYVTEIAAALNNQDQDLWLTASEPFGQPLDENTLPTPPKEVVDFTIARVIEDIRKDLEILGIQFDHWFSERTLHQEGGIDRVLAHLVEKNLIYQGVLERPKGGDVDSSDETDLRLQTLFRATEFGDDADRSLKKADGSYTYFAADIAYHFDKAKRGYDLLVDVWGADHGGYVKRVQAALEAMTGRKDLLDVVLTQMVNLTQGGKQVRMSKRAGTFVTLREVLEETGADAVRFWFLTRSSGAGLDFDLDLAKAKTNDNPVFYVQYAHARVYSLFAKLKERSLSEGEGDLSRLVAPEELDLIRLLGVFPEVVESAALSREPHRLTYYLLELAAVFHGYYNNYRILDEDPELRGARLSLIRAAGQVIANGLTLMGVSAPVSM
ncbi:MAG: arginine--tRNA ligase [Magnetococcales bacterium]|nr:arginine--tRNA ligase [Magnetococcales bacterium]